jgi:transposase-like protein
MSAPRRRQYSDSQKAEALAAVDANGGNVSATAAALGIPQKTLDCWFRKRGVNPEVAQMRLGKKEDLADRLEDLAHKLLDSATAKIGDANLSNVTVALGISIDKMRLLREQPTSITAALTDDERADRVAALLERARARRDGRAALRAI